MLVSRTAGRWSICVDPHTFSRCSHFSAVVQNGKVLSMPRTNSENSVHQSVVHRFDPVLRNLWMINRKVDISGHSLCGQQNWNILLRTNSFCESVLTKRQKNSRDFLHFSCFSSCLASRLASRLASCLSDRQKPLERRIDWSRDNQANVIHKLIKRLHSKALQNNHNNDFHSFPFPLRHLNRERRPLFAELSSSVFCQV